MRAPIIRAAFDGDLVVAPRADNGRFLPGHAYSTSTQFKKGEHRSVSSEFQPGVAAHNKLPVGSVRVRVETPVDYDLTTGVDGKPLTKTAQTRLAGNSVCPQVAAAIVRANGDARAMHAGGAA